MIRIVVLISLALLTACKVDQTPAADPAPAPVTSPTASPQALAKDCSLVTESLALSGRTVKMPATGKFVLESHLKATSDTFPGWPRTTREHIDQHISDSCVMLKVMAPGSDCAKAYASQYVRVWTPSEGGHIGQGAVGALLPPLAHEMWSGNMMFTAKSKPMPGTRFLASANGKNVVVVMGYEVGPSDKAYLGGLQGEAIYILGTNTAKFGRLKDQTLAPGPINCR